MDCETVVLADEEDGEPMLGCEVDAVAEDTFFGRSVTEEGDGHLSGLAAAKGQGLAYGESGWLCRRSPMRDDIVMRVD